MNYDIEINEEWYISVKGTAKAYDVRVDTILKQMQKNPSIFNEHVISEKFVNKNFINNLSKELKYKPKRKWLDKFAFVEIGTLLNSSPKTIPIKAIYFLNNE